MRWWRDPLCSRPTYWVGFLVLAHWNYSPQIDMSFHLDTLFWFRANQSLLFLLNATCLAEKQQIPILKSLVCPDPGSNPRSTALEASTLIFTPLMHLLKVRHEWYVLLYMYTYILLTIAHCCLRLPKKWFVLFLGILLTIKWVSDCCLTPTQQLFSYIMARAQSPIFLLIAMYLAEKQQISILYSLCHSVFGLLEN
jgi:hypothetical protein